MLVHFCSPPSQLEEAQETLEKTSDPSILRSQVFSPLLALSLLLNLVLGGKVLGGQGVGGQVLDLLGPLSPLITRALEMTEKKEEKDEEPLLQLTNMLSSKLLSGEEGLLWRRQEKENEIEEDPIKVLKKVKKDRDDRFGRKKDYRRRQRVQSFRDK